MTLRAGVCGQDQKKTTINHSSAHLKLHHYSHSDRRMFKSSYVCITNYRTNFSNLPQLCWGYTSFSCVKAPAYDHISYIASLSFILYEMAIFHTIYHIGFIHCYIWEMSFEMKYLKYNWWRLDKSNFKSSLSWTGSRFYTTGCPQRFLMLWSHIACGVLAAAVRRP